MLFGALMVVTGLTVIVPMLRTVRPKENVANILKWEGILIDATLTVLVYQFIISEAAQDGLFAAMTVSGKILSVGCLLGIAIGYLFGVALRRHWIPQYLHNFTGMALILCYHLDLN